MNNAYVLYTKLKLSIILYLKLFYTLRHKTEVVELVPLFQVLVERVEQLIKFTDFKKKII